MIRFAQKHRVARENFSHAAAPVGGTVQVVRGCLLFLLLSATPAAAIDLPSGTQAALQEVLVDQVDDATYVRFRFVAPLIDRDLEHAPDYSALEADFPHLCSQFVLPYLDEYALAADKVVISLADRIVEFGTSDPEATQYFEQFRAENGDCIWEGF